MNTFLLVLIVYLLTLVGAVALFVIEDLVALSSGTDKIWTFSTYVKHFRRKHHFFGWVLILSFTLGPSVYLIGHLGFEAW